MLLCYYVGIVNSLKDFFAKKVWIVQLILPHISYSICSSKNTQAIQQVYQLDMCQSSDHLVSCKQKGASQSVSM